MTDIIEDFSPIYVGDTGALLKPHFRNKDKTPVDLTGATISMIMQNRDSPSTVKEATGTWEIDDATNGIAHYTYSAEDVDTAAVWNLFINIEIEGNPLHADVKHLRILALPVVTP